MSEWPPSTRPYRANPPEGSVGIVLPVRDNLRFFKLAYHSLLDFTDYRFMLTVVDNMSSIQTRQYLESIRRNHNINVLQYQKEHSLEEEWNLGLRFMFSFATVKFGVVLTPTVVVEPFWLSRLVRLLEENKDTMTAIPESNTMSTNFWAFRRENYEAVGLKHLVESTGWIRSRDVYVHKFKVNGYDPRRSPAQEEATHVGA